MAQLNTEKNKMRRPKRNRTNIQWEGLRTYILSSGKMFDEVFEEFADELKECYHGDRDIKGKFIRNGSTGWKHGYDASFYGYNRKSRKEDSKEQYDKIYGHIWDFYNVGINNLNIDLGEPETDMFPEPLEPNRKSTLGYSVERLSVLQTEDPALYNMMKNHFKQEGVRLD